MKNFIKSTNKEVATDCHNSSITTSTNFTLPRIRKLYKATIITSIVLILLSSLNNNVFATAYISNTSGSVNTSANWTPAGVFPGLAGDTWQIQNAMTVTAGATFSLSGSVIITTGGTLTVGNTPAVSTILNIGTNLTISGSGSLIINANATANTTVNVTGTTTVSTSASPAIAFQTATGTTGTAIINATGNVTLSPTGLKIIDWGTGTIAGNAWNIRGNLTISGTGTLSTTSTTSSATGFVFNGSGTAASPQLLSNTSTGSLASTSSSYTVNSGTYVKLSAALGLGTVTTVRSALNVNSGGTFDISTFVVSGGSATAGLIVNAGSTLACGNATGISATSITAVNSLNAGAGYIYNGAVAQVTGALLPTSLSTPAFLTINNAAGVTLTTSTTLQTGTALNINSGTFVLGAPTITLQAGSTLNLNNGAITNNAANLSVSGAVVRDAATIAAIPTVYPITSLTYTNLGTNTALITTGNEWPITLTSPVTINKTGATITLNASKTGPVASLTVSNGTLSASTFALSVSGTVTNNGTITTNTGGITFSSDFTNNGTFSSTGVSAISIAGNLTNTGTITESTTGTISLSNTGSNVWVNNGTFNAGTGTVTFTGAAPTISGASSTIFNKLTLNNSSGTNLASNCTVSGLLTFTNGKLSINNNTLTLGGTVAGMSALNCISGNGAASNLNLTNAGALGTLWFDQTTIGNTNNISTLTIAGVGGAILGNNLVVSGTLNYISPAKLSIGSTTLTLSGVVSGMTASSVLTGSVASNLTLTNLTTLGNLFFDPTTVGTTNKLATFTINGAGGATLGNNLVIATSLIQTTGNLAIGATTLTLAGTYSGSAASCLSGNGTSSNLTLTNASALGALFFDQSVVGTTNEIATFTLNGAGGAILGNNLIIANALTQTSGKLAIGTTTLTLAGTYSGAAANSLTSNGTSSNLTLTNAGALGTLWFDQTTVGTTNKIATLTVNGAGGAILGNNLVIGNSLTYTSTAKLSIGSTTLTLVGVVSGMSASNVLTGSATSNLTLTNPTALGTLFFDQTTIGTSNKIATFTVNGVGGSALGNNLVVGTTLAFTTGTVAINGTTLTLAGTVSGMSAANVLTGSSASNLSLTNAAALGTVFFDQSNVGVSNNINTFTINGAGSSILGNALNISSTLNLYNGTLTNATFLTISNGATINRDNGILSAIPTWGIGGTGLINVAYTSGGPNTLAITTNKELPITTTNLNTLTINKTGAIITLGGSPTVNAALTITSGILSIGANTLTLQGTVSGMNATNTLRGGATSNLILTNPTALGQLWFDQTTVGTTNKIATFTVNGIGGATLGNNLVVGTSFTFSAAGKIGINGTTLSIAGTVSGMSVANSFTGSTTSNLTLTNIAALGTLFFDQTTPGTTNNLNTLTINGAAGSSILGNSLNISSTLNLYNGTFTNSTFLTLLTGATINRDNGTISAIPTWGIGGTGLINVVYTTGGPNTLAITTGNELPLTTTNLNNLSVNKTGAVITLGASPKVNASLTLTNGILAIGANTLTLNGIVGSMSSTNSLRGSATSNLTLTNATSLGTLFFDQTTVGTSNKIATFIVNGAGGALLGNNLIVANALTQTSGILGIGASTLTLAGTYSGNAANCLSGNGVSSNLILNNVTPLGTLYFDQTTINTTNNIATFTLSGVGGANLGNNLVIANSLTYTAVAKLAINATSLTLAGVVSGMSATSVLTGSNSSNLTLTNPTALGALFFDPTTNGTSNNLATLTMNGAGGFTLGNTLNLSSSLSLSLGNITLGSNNLFLGTSNIITGGSASSMLITNSTGLVQQSYSGAGAFTYPVGDALGNFTPITINVSGTTFPLGNYIGINVTNAKHPNNSNSTNFLNRYWSIINSGITSPVYSINATYVLADVVGTESNIKAGWYPNSLPWSIYSPANTSTHILTATGINTASGAITGIANSNPFVNITPATSNACVGNPIALSTTGVVADPPATFSWSATSGSVSPSTGTSTSFTPSATGTSTVTVTITDGNGFTSTGTSVITALPTPIISGGTATPSTVCAGSSFILLASGTGADTFYWSGPLSYSANQWSDTINAITAIGGVYSFTATSYATGCSTVKTALVTINLQPNSLTGTPSSNSICNTTNNLTLTGVENGAVGATYSWSGPGGYTSTLLTPGVITNSVSGIYSLIATTPACPLVTATTTNIIVNPLPSTIIGSTLICTGNTYTLTDGTYGGTWSSSNTSVANINSSTGVITVGTTGLATITYTSTAGCIITQSETANPTPAAIGGGSVSVCVGGTTAAFTDATVGGTWSSGTTSVATIIGSGIATGVLGGTSLISYTIAGCSSVATLGVAFYTAALPWSEGFEGTVTANVLNNCNELLGELPPITQPNGQWGVGTPAQVETATGSYPAGGFGADPSAPVPTHTGSYMAGFGFNASNGFYFTPGFALIAGNTYQFSYYYVTDGKGGTGDYNAYMYYNTNQSLTGASAFQSYSVAVTPGVTSALAKSPVLLNFNNATYLQWTGYFSPSTSGNYYFGINARDNNLTNTYYWAFDDLNFAICANCVAPSAPSVVTAVPSLGSTTNITTTAAGADSFITIAMIDPATPSSGPLTGVNYALGANLGGGVVIAKGLPSIPTTIAPGFLAAATNYKFYTYAFKHDSCNSVAYSTVAAAVPTFTTCATAVPNAPLISAMTPGIGGTGSITITGLPTSAGSTVTLYAWTNQTASTPASPATYTVTSLSPTYSVTGVSSGNNLWFTIQQSNGGCSVTSSISSQASVPFALPWNQNFETSSSLNNDNPNFMLGNAPVYVNAGGSHYGGEDNNGGTTPLITPHGGTWDYLFFGGARSPSTGVAFTSVSAYANQWLVTPGLYCPNAGTYNLSFWYNNAGNALPAINIQYSNIPGLPLNSSSSMTGGNVISSFIPTTGGWVQYSVPITISSGPQTIFVGIDFTVDATSSYLAIDDIEICQKPAITLTNSTSTTPICSSGNFSLNATPTPVANLTSGNWNYTWSGPGTITSTGANATATGLSTVGITPVYSVVAVNSGDVWAQCRSAYATSVATITPIPASITGVSSMCGGTTSVYLGGAVYGTPGWSITGIGTTYTSGTVISGYSVATSNPPSQQTFSVNYQNMCGSVTQPVILNVQPVSITDGATSICTSNATPAFTDATGGGTWSTNVTTFGTINGGGIFTSSATNTGTTIISYTETIGGCFATSSIVVGNNGPSAITGGPYIVCTGANVTITSPTPTGGTWSSSNTNFASVNAASGIVTGVANGVVNISYSSGCGSGVGTSVTVNGTSGNIVNSSPVCSGSSFTLNATSILPSSGTSYSWSGPGTIVSSTSNIATVSAPAMNANGTYTLTTTNSGCNNTFTTIGTVIQAPPTPTISSLPLSPICSGTSTVLSASIATETPQAFLIPVYTPTFTVLGTLNSATTGTGWSGGTSANGYFAATIPFNFNFFGITFNTVNISTNGFVNFGSGSLVATPNTIPSATAPTNIIALFQHPMNVSSTGTIQYGIGGIAPNRQFVIYYNAVPDASNTNTGYLVLNETTSIIDALVLSHSGASGNATCGIENNGGTIGVAATGRNNATYTLASPEGWRFYCLNNYNYLWSPAGSLSTTTGSNPSTTPLATATTFTLTAQDAIDNTCSSTNTYTVSVTPTASISITNPEACSGATYANLSFTSVAGSPTSYSVSWDASASAIGFTPSGVITFPVGTSGYIPISFTGVTVSAGQSYNGFITVYNLAGCSTTYPFTLSIKAQPDLSVATVSVISPSFSNMCSGQVISLVVTGGTGSADPYVYTWKGPGINGTVTTATNSLDYVTNTSTMVAGSYSVSLGSSSVGCNTTSFKVAVGVYTVYGAPTLSSASNSGSGFACIGSSVFLYANGATNVTNYSWAGPDAIINSSSATATVSIPSTFGVNIYTVTVSNGGGSGCFANYTTSFTLNFAPSLTGTSNTGTVCAGNSPITLRALGASHVLGYTWCGPDAITNSTVATATVSLPTTVGNDVYTVTVNNGSGIGCSVSYTTAVFVNPTPTAIVSNNGPICKGGIINLTASPVGGTTTYNWSGVSLLSTTGATPTATPTLTTTYSLTVSSGATPGCSPATIYTTVVTVNAIPTATVANNGPVCAGGAVTLTATPANGASIFSWSGPSLVSTSGVTTTATPTVNGTYSLTVSSSSHSGCSPATVYTTSVVVVPQPTVTLSASKLNLCSGGNELLTTGSSGGIGTTTYTWSGPGINITTSHTPTPLALTPTVITTISMAYSVSVSYSGTGCITPNASSAVVVVETAPKLGAIATNVTELCTGATVTISEIGLTQEPLSGTKLYTWSGPTGIIATMTALTNTTFNTFTASATSYSGVYSLSAVYSEEGCNAGSIFTLPITVATQPTGSLNFSYPSSLCYGLTETITVSMSGGIGVPNFTWNVPGISSSYSTGSIPSYSLIPTTSGIYTVIVAYPTEGCNSDTFISGIITLTPLTWVGTTPDWNSSANWSCGYVPTVTDSVLIPSAPINAPTISTSCSVYQLALTTGSTVTISDGATLSVYGNLLSRGTITGDGNLYLTGSVPQFIFGVGHVNNIEIHNSNGVTINSIAPFTSDSLIARGSVKLSLGNLNTKDVLVLEVSDTTAQLNGRIDPITAGATIYGKVIMQQYIKAGQRAYRFWGTPFNESIPLSQLETYMDITGAGGSAHGFTNTVSNAPSAFWYNPMVANNTAHPDPGWIPFTYCNDVWTGGVHTSGDNNLLHQYQGIRLFFRGSKGEGLDLPLGIWYQIDACIVRDWGHVNTGHIDMPLQMGTAITSHVNQMSNPYPCPVDIGSVVHTAYANGMLYSPTVWLWDAYLGSGGNFVAQDESGPLAVPCIIPANTSFQVNTAYNGAILQFDETNKAVIPTYPILKTNPDILTLNVYDESYHKWDIFRMKFMDETTDEIDRDWDAEKLAGMDLNFYSWSSDHHPLTIDKRPFTAGKVVPLGITSNFLQTFIIRADNYSLPNGGQLYLHDKLLEKYILLGQGVEYKFEITKDPATQGDNRFELGMEPFEPPIHETAKSLKMLMIPNPASIRVNITFNAPANEQTSIRILSVEGICLMAQDLGKMQSGNLTLSLNNLSSGVYMVELTSGCNKIVQRLVKE